MSCKFLVDLFFFSLSLSNKVRFSAVAGAAPLTMKMRLREGGGALERRKRGVKENEGEKRGGSEKGEITESTRKRGGWRGKNEQVY